MRSESDVSRAIDAHADTVERLCAVHLANPSDADDVFQTVFFRFAQHDAAFESEEHERAWIIRVTINACRDLARSAAWRRTVALDETIEAVLPAADDTPRAQEELDEARRVLRAVLSLPEDYRQAVYLHYYEGYSAPEIARAMDRKVNTVYTLLRRARKRLARIIGGGAHER